jgi:hypothetical protein
MSKKFRVQGILWESLDDGVCFKLGLSISETEKQQCDVRILRNFQQFQSRSARLPE